VQMREISASISASTSRNSVLIWSELNIAVSGHP
jgi:hypothetical protein